MNSLDKFAYQWPSEELSLNKNWKESEDGRNLEFTLPEKPEDLAKDSRWPAFFPSPISIVTTYDGDVQLIEKVVGANIVNRFPYIVSLSFAIEDISKRHHKRQNFIEVLEKTGKIAVQFLPPGDSLQKIMQTINSTTDETALERMESTNLPYRKAYSNDAAVFEDAYMVYEASLVKPAKDFFNNDIFLTPYHDLGSHRIYFFEINTIQLHEDIAKRNKQISWKSLPEWKKESTTVDLVSNTTEKSIPKYSKGYSPYYLFPSENTVQFPTDLIENNMAIQVFKPISYEEVTKDNDAARWPCFFPSSLGMITSLDRNNLPNLMPCGSTSIISRYPLIIAPCICYAEVNDRYNKRASLENIRLTKKFGCGVAFIDDSIVEGIKYSGSVSIANDPHKIRNSGFTIEIINEIPFINELPIYFECELTGEILLGTHTMLLGKVTKIIVSKTLNPANKLTWYPWADII